MATSQTSGPSAQSLGLIPLILAFGVSNRVLNKMALVPLQGYEFFLAQLVTFGYVGVYFAVLAYQYSIGKVSNTMLSIDKRVFVLIGLFEAVQLVMLLLATQNLPGVILPLLAQSLLFWQLLFSSLILGKKYTLKQVLGVVAVVGGVVVAALPSKGSSLQIPYMWAAVFVAALALPAFSTILKERAFRQFEEKHGEKLSVFIVNSFGSGFQAVFVFLLLPVLSNLKGIALKELPAYFQRGLAAISGQGSGSFAEAAPWLALGYVGANLLFNVTALMGVRSLGSVVMGLLVAVLVPLTIWAFTFHLPLLGPGPVLGPNFMAGASVLTFGLLLFNSDTLLPAVQKRLGKGKVA